MKIFKILLIAILPVGASAQVMGPTDIIPCGDPFEVVEPTVQCGFNDIGAPNPGRFLVSYVDSGAGCQESGRILLGCLPA